MAQPDIREERAGDADGIADVTARAFAGAEHSDGTEPAIIARLRGSGLLALSLVAVDESRVVGHVAFSPVTIAGSASGWFGMGPLSVLPGYQSQGVGTALVRAGLDRLRARGAAGCVVLGEPGYYRRFGFVQDPRLRYDAAPPEYFMRLPLDDGAVPTGKVDYAAAFTG